jgi:uncharacterized protein YcfJ
VLTKEFIMKRLSTVLVAASLALVCLPACAGHKSSGYDKARVIQAVPIYTTVRYPVDEQVCWEEQVWGSRVNHRHGRYPVIQTRCEVQRNWRTEQRLAAWDVTYKYHGAIYMTRTPEKPGKHIRVRADMAQVNYQYGRY